MKLRKLFTLLYFGIISTLLFYMFYYTYINVLTDIININTTILIFTLVILSIELSIIVNIPLIGIILKTKENNKKKQEEQNARISITELDYFEIQ